jgi:hypothetical protein
MNSTLKVLVDEAIIARARAARALVRVAPPDAMLAQLLNINLSAGDKVYDSVTGAEVTVERIGVENVDPNSAVAAY